eukprot:XP_001706118.1 Hypothetical protein GL50803_36036 [Giardia lamblia ATCC 50803]
MYKRIAGPVRICSSCISRYGKMHVGPNTVTRFISVMLFSGSPATFSKCLAKTSKNSLLSWSRKLSYTRVRARSGACPNFSSKYKIIFRAG